MRAGGIIYWPMLAPGPRPHVMRKITVTDIDEQRLRRLIELRAGGRDAELVERLEAELEHAEVVRASAVPPDVVTMDSVVVYEDDRGRRTQVKLVYPDTVADEPRVSVLAPVGSALLGLSIGDAIDWPLPNGRTRRLRVVDVLYQPESARKGA
jgi:regulator of nucleoside diphosphate kinase